jgi:hypothetical protein
VSSTGAGFFHIDRRVWKMLCDHKNINMAVAYLSIASGTGKGNVSSFWSAQAIEKYTGLHNTRAKTAIGELIASDFMRRGDKSSRTRPLYELQPYQTIMGTLQAKTFRDDYSVLILDAVRAGRKLSSNYKQWAEKWVADGVMWKLGDKFSVTPPLAESAAELIWLPNTLVTGTAKAEASPVKRLRSRGDIWALRLLIDLYQAQNLSADGGISRKVLKHEYERKKYGERGHHVVWGFKSKQSWASHHSSTKIFWDRKAAEKPNENPIWDSLKALQSMGLLTVVPHLVENASDDCEPIHGFGWNGTGEEIERELGEAADVAGRYIIGEQRLYTAETVDAVDMLVPVWETQVDVQMVGVYRLTYRPHTQLTADWQRRMHLKASEWMEIYKKIGPQNYELPVASGFSQ